MIGTTLTHPFKSLLLLILLAGSSHAFSFDQEKEVKRREVLADTTEQKWSPGGAFLRSMVVPGWGQAYLEKPRSGKLQFALEIGLLVGGWGIYNYAEAKRDEYVSFAARYAGVHERSRDSDYWVHISKYDSREAYNLAMLRANLPHLRYLNTADDWQWTSTDHRAHYRNTRALSEDSYSQLLAVGGAILMNHVISGIHAMKLAGRLNHGAIQATAQNGRLGIAIALN